MKSILSLQEHAAGTFFPAALERKIRRSDAGKDEQHTHSGSEEEEENPSTAAKKC